MGVVVGLGVGVGLLLVWTSFAVPRRPTKQGEPSALRRRLDRAGLVALSVQALVGLCVSLFVVGFLAVQVLSRTLPVSLVFACMAGWSPLAVVSTRARRREREVSEVWPDAMDNLASAVRAGLSLAEALAALGERGPEPLRPAFVTFGSEYQLSGRFEECLDRLKARLADPVGDRVVEALRMAREVGGGDLGRLLRTLSEHLRDDARTRSELEARQSWAVNGARLAVAAPWLVLLSMCFQREVITRYASPAGVVVLGLGTATCLAAYRLMLRIGRLPVDKRVMS